MFTTSKQSFYFQIKVPFIHFSLLFIALVGSRIEPNGAAENIDFSVVGVWMLLFAVWMWWNGDQSIWRAQRCAWWVQLGFVFSWNAKNVHCHCGEFSKARFDSRLRKYHVCTSIIQNGMHRYLYDWYRILVLRFIFKFSNTYRLVGLVSSISRCYVNSMGKASVWWL